MDLGEIEVRHLEAGGDLAAYKDDVWRLIEAVNHDYIPPLSARTNATELDLVQKHDVWGGPIMFFEAVLREHVLMAFHHGQAVAMMSFIAHFHEPFLEEWSPSTYISLTAVLSKYKRQGIEDLLGEQLGALPPDVASPWITRRSGSTNIALIEALLKKDFTEVVRVPDNRGKGMHTLYFARPTDPAKHIEVAEPIVIADYLPFESHPG